MAELRYPGVDPTVTPVSARQEAVLRRQGWTDVDDAPADDVEHVELPPPPDITEADEAHTEES